MTLPLQNGHMVGRVTALSNREFIGDLGAFDIRIPRIRAAFANAFRPISEHYFSNKDACITTTELFICGQRVRPRASVVI